MRFDFSTVDRIAFGAGVAAEAPATARSLGRRVMLVRGSTADRSAMLFTALQDHGLDVTTFAAASEPTIASMRDGTAQAHEGKCDLIVAMGGGSVLDTGKAIAALLGNGGDPLDYIEVIGRGQPLKRPSIPMLAIPTTAGTGTEVTRNAVMSSPEHGVKASLRGRQLLPTAAFVDPDLLRDLPPRIIAASGLDALSQLIEPYVCTRANPLVDGLCREGIARSARSLRRAYEGNRSTAALTDLAAASLMSGLALANAGLGAVHGLAAPIGGRFPAPHGAVCATLLPHVMEANIRGLRRRNSDASALDRYRDIARLLTKGESSDPQDGVSWILDLCRALEVPGLACWGVERGDFPALISGAKKASSMRANPVTLTGEELSEILDAAL